MQEFRERTFCTMKDGSEYKECIICYEEEMLRHHHNKHQEFQIELNRKRAPEIADMYAKEKAKDEDPKDYVDYYLFHYARRYRELYKTVKVDFYSRPDLEKIRQEIYKKNKEADDTEVCSYHQENILWLDCPVLDMYTKEKEETIEKVSESEDYSNYAYF